MFFSLVLILTLTSQIPVCNNPACIDRLTNKSVIAIGGAVTDQDIIRLLHSNNHIIKLYIGTKGAYKANLSGKVLRVISKTQKKLKVLEINSNNLSDNDIILINIGTLRNLGIIGNGKLTLNVIYQIPCRTARNLEYLRLVGLHPSICIIGSDSANCNFIYQNENIVASISIETNSTRPELPDLSCNEAMVKNNGDEAIIILKAKFTRLRLLVISKNLKDALSDMVAEIKNPSPFLKIRVIP